LIWDLDGRECRVGQCSKLFLDVGNLLRKFFPVFHLLPDFPLMPLCIGLPTFLEILSVGPLPHDGDCIGTAHFEDLLYGAPDAQELFKPVRLGFRDADARSMEPFVALVASDHEAIVWPTANAVASRRLL